MMHSSAFPLCTAYQSIAGLDIPPTKTVIAFGRHYGGETLPTHCGGRKQ